MILIADSGSTKTDWRVIDDKGVIGQAQTAGINPYYQSVQEITEVLQDSLKPQIQSPVEKVYFYGAGCNNQDKNNLISQAIQAVFGEVSTSVNSDLLAVARGLCGHDAGIACILGTGSNSCYYDGEKIADHIPPWGTWLGDEGSGSVLGRELVIRYLNQELPVNLQQAFTKRYPDIRETVLDHVYRKPYPNRYLGNFSKFLFHHLNDPFVYQLIYSGFQLFLERKVLKYQKAVELPVHFCGSIGFYFNTVLRKAAVDKGLTVKNIVENPIAGLTLYHQIH